MPMPIRQPIALAAAMLAAAFSANVVAADVQTDIPEGTSVDTLQVLSAPGAADSHRLLLEGVLASPLGADLLMIQGSGAGSIVVDVHGALGGIVDFSAVNGSVELNINEGSWRTSPQGWWPSNADLVNRLGSGADTMNVGEDASVNIVGGIDFGTGLDVVNNEGSFLVARTWGLEEINNSGSFAFTGDSEDADLRRIVNSGTFSVSYERDQSAGDAAASLVAPNLERFENSGVISMIGAMGIIEYSNRIFLPGAEFIASGDSQLRVNAFLGDAPQPTCEASSSGQVDCLSLVGGSVSGVTKVFVQSQIPDKGLAYHSQGMVVVDVGGGQTDGSNFVLDETSPGYEADAPFGGGLRGDEMFTVHLLYDDASQSYRLMAVPDAKVGLLGMLPMMGQSLWRTAESTSVARQAELRRHKVGGGAWAKATESSTEHDTQFGASVLGNAITTPVGYEHKDRSVSVGVDGTMEGEGWRYSMGASFGSLNSNLSIDAAGGRGRTDATAVAVYGSFQRGKLFVDFSGSGYAGDFDGSVALSQNVYPIHATVDAIGGRIESGYRLSLGDSAAIEPLLSMVYVRSGVGAVQHLSGNKSNAMVFDSAESLRGGIGARFDFDRALESSLRLMTSVSVRAWEEFEGQTQANLRTLRESLPFTGSLDGRFTEVDAMVGIGRGAGMVYLSYGGQFGDDYDRTTASAGFRYSW